MTQKKYELMDDTIQHNGRTLHRIRALVEIAAFCVRAGELGGYVEAEKNLSMFGDAWVSGDAKVFGDAEVFGDAWVSGDARVYGDAWVFGDARVSGAAKVFGDAWVFGDARVSGAAEVFGDAEVYGDARVFGDAEVFGDARVYGDARVAGKARMYDKQHLFAIGPVGSENGVLTVCRAEGGILVNRGCFSGSLAEFERAVQENHGDNKYGQEYRLLIELAKLRAAEWEGE